MGVGVGALHTSIQQYFFVIYYVRIMNNSLYIEVSNTIH